MSFIPPEQVKRVMEEFWNFVLRSGVMLHVRMLPRTPHTPVNLGGWNLACIIHGWLQSHQPDFWYFAWKLRYAISKFYTCVFNSSHNFKVREKFIKQHILFKHLAKIVVFSSFKIDEAMNFLSGHVAWEVRYIYFSPQKNTRLLN